MNKTAQVYSSGLGFFPPKPFPGVFSLAKVFFGILLSLACFCSSAYAAGESPDLSNDQMKGFIQDQFEGMYDKAIGSAGPRLENGESVKAFAVVTDKASNMRLVRIKQVEEMPPAMALEVMRRSLRVLVGKGDVGATCLVYIADNPNKESDAKYVLVAEMEHIFGPTLAQITPYTVVDGKAKFAKPVVVESKPSIFKYKTEGKAASEGATSDSE